MSSDCAWEKWLLHRHGCSYTCRWWSVEVDTCDDEPIVENRHFMWSTLQDLKAVSDWLWLVIGDFDEVVWNFEHMSLTPRPSPLMAAFRHTLMLCEQVDLGFAGVPYTYDNMRSGLLMLEFIWILQWQRIHGEICMRFLQCSISHPPDLTMYHAPGF